MAISFAALSLTAPPVASLALLTGGCGRCSSARVVRSPSSARVSPLLHTSFLSSPSTVLSFPSSLSGLSLGVDLGSSNLVRQKRGVLQVRAAGRALLCMTKRNRSRKSLARTHGFRRRMRTPGGRGVLSRRRAKGRKVLCTKSSPSSGKRCRRA